VIDLTLLGLLPELVLRILAYLDPGSLCQVSLTCTYLKSLADSQVPLPSPFRSLLRLFSFRVLESARFPTIPSSGIPFPFPFPFVPRPGWFLWDLLEIPYGYHDRKIVHSY